MVCRARVTSGRGLRLRWKGRRGEALVRFAYTPPPEYDSRRGPDERSRGASSVRERSPTPPSTSSSLPGWEGVRGPLLAGAFALGIGAGVALTSTVTFEKTNIASTEIVDRKSPSNAVCIENGYSAMVFDQRLFVSFNPFNVYVSQPEIKPGCVLRRSNTALLEKKGIVSSTEAQSCKRNMNTFGYVGNLDDRPEASCIYHSEEAENQFMNDPRRAALGDGFRLKPDDEKRASTSDIGES